MLELLLAGLIVVLVALLVAWLRRTPRRSPLQDSITEAQARENAAPLTTAIIGSDHPKRTGW